MYWYIGAIPLLAICTVINLVSLDAIHSIQEGFVGVYTRGGSLMPATTEAGIHYMLPLITKVNRV